MKELKEAAEYGSFNSWPGSENSIGDNKTGYRETMINEGLNLGLTKWIRHVALGLRDRISTSWHG